MNEEAVVTTTDNGGQGLDSPKLPIKPSNIFRRVKQLINKVKPKVSSN